MDFGTASDNSVAAPLSYDEIKGLEESLSGPCWRALQTPLNQSLESFLGIENLSKFRESVCDLKDKLQNGTSPSDIQEALQVSESNAFLRKMTGLCDSQSLSARAASELAAFDKRTEEPLDKGLLEHQLHESHSQEFALESALFSCENQMKVFQGTVLEAHDIMRELTNRWSQEKVRAEGMKQKLNVISDSSYSEDRELQELKEELYKSEKKLLEHKKRKHCGNSATQTQEDPELAELTAKGQRLSEQVQRNAQVFQQLATTITMNSELENELRDKNRAIEKVKAEQREVIEAVDQLVGAAQRLLAKNSKGSRLAEMLELMGSLQSIKFSE